MPAGPAARCARGTPRGRCVVREAVVPTDQAREQHREGIGLFRCGLGPLQRIESREADGRRKMAGFRSHFFFSSSIVMLMFFFLPCFLASLLPSFLLGI
ncbi:hypothetical protein IF1G_08739 [Cordyceps javanica]|uniref:Transmembrane protein n=1 Tax=Cordyceps javanica TaxID=43265 RepID=A0A545UTR1_9HYPO|nr:hypothetical protein IF1G_08739 [Cordyceps javanica]